MFTADAKRYGLHSSNPKEKMSPKELMKLLDSLNVPYPEKADRKVLLDILEGATPIHYRFKPEPQPTPK